MRRASGGALPFAGRDTELADLDRWLAAPDAPPYRLVSGPAGVGKSTLLVRWASALVAGATAEVVFVPISVRTRPTPTVPCSRRWSAGPTELLRLRGRLLERH